MNKVLVCYFSASGVTRRVAKKIAEVVKGDLFEIEPQEAYTEQDLNWNDPQSRSSIEMKNKSSRPEIKKKDINIDDYDTILIGFPIWWYQAPTIINTFLENVDLTKKTIVPFCTSGGSGIEEAVEILKETYPNYNFKEGKRFTGQEDKNSIESWIQSKLI